MVRIGLVAADANVTVPPKPATVLRYKGLVAAALDARGFVTPIRRNAHGPAVRSMDALSSAMTETKRAQNVCRFCKLRKKACDKALPACGFCASRRLLCEYDSILAPKSKSRRSYNPGKHFVPLETPSTRSVSPLNTTVARLPPSPESQPDRSLTHHFSLPLSTQSLDESLNRLAEQFCELTNLTTDKIIDRYFKACHKWLPVVPPDSVRREASLYREGGSLPPADVTVLLLAMLLITLPSLETSVRPPLSTQELIYLATKSALAQAQASICTSLWLVQAAYLIALREYTCFRPEAAYISMMNCIGLARVMGIGTTLKSTAGKGGSRLEEMAEENLTWAIAMLERLILCEMDRRDLEPQTDFLGPELRLPSDPKPTAGLASMPRSNLETLNQALSSVNTTDFDQLKWQAQSVFLLDRLLFVMRLTTSKKETKLAALAELDAEIRGFLEVVMRELEWRQTPTCIFVALCVRLLFLLHGTILDTIRYPHSESDHEKRNLSYMGLDLACKMVLDVAKWHHEEKGQMMPICCFYNLRAARKRMQERNELVANTALSDDITHLLRAEEKYRETWVF